MNQPTPHIYYYTHPTTQGTHNLTTHLNYPATNINNAEPPQHPYILITPTYTGNPNKGGYLPSQLRHWLNNKNAQQNLVGIIGTGDINWGKEFCAAADELSAQHGAPVLYRVDRWGNTNDHNNINNGIRTHWRTLLRMQEARNANRKL